MALLLLLLPHRFVLSVARKATEKNCDLHNGLNVTK